ncbi:MAG: M23 family metallopeptidase [Leptospiraceae bacterium]|nr:M23 family metallopeptidase [Leptospiraceae bacterium]MCP5513010.1 M23 family metallopeptidase [Leptospiraceae bacterium]
MIIPHSEKKSIKISISYRSITLFGIIIGLLTFFSAFIVLKFSGMNHELNELQISNEDFIIQSKRLKTEMKTLHEHSSLYYEKILNLYIKLGGDPQKIYHLPDREIIGFLEPNSDVFPETYRLQSDIYNLNTANLLTKEIIKIIKDKNNIIQNTPSLWPTKGYILYPFGKYFSPVAGGEVINYGVDIGTFPGAQVIATAPGEVYELGYSQSTGYFIKISHKYGWKTIYSNLERIQVKKNQIIKKGETIGFAGKTSLNPTYLLHYEVHVGTSPLNPHSFLNQVQN